MSTELGFEARAAQAFLERHPEYETTPGNSRILVAEVLKLVEAGADGADILTFEQAFENRKSALKLKELPQPETPLEMTIEYLSPEYFRELPTEEKNTIGERLLKLSPKEIDKLPDHLARFFVNYDVRQRSKVVISEADAILKPLFEDAEFSDNTKNRAILAQWLNKRELNYTLGNLKVAISECAEHLEPSQQAIERMSADQFKKTIIDPEVRKQQAEKAKKPNQGRGNPPGFDYVSWVNGQ